MAAECLVEAIVARMAIGSSAIGRASITQIDAAFGGLGERLDIQVRDAAYREGTGVSPEWS